MKIAFRTSGGRGEYELAGKQGSTTVSDLFDYSFDFQVSPYILVPGHCSLGKQGGKPRIRLEGGEATHAYRWLSALLLLPKPNRVRGVSGPTEESGIHLGSGYQISGIRVDVAETKNKHCLLRPTLLEIHQGQTQQLVSVPERIARVQAVIANKDKFPEPIARLISDFEDQTKGAISHKKLEGLRAAIYKETQAVDDALLSLERLLPQEEEYVLAGQNIEVSDAVSADGEVDERSAIEVRADFIRTWRQVAERGHKGRKFSKDVMQAYGERCIVSGSHLPKTAANPIPGVDAAHILPWAKYDLDKVTNGICLAKTYHWAFDSGILRLSYDPDANCYVVSMDAETRKILAASEFDLGLFDPHLGAVPEARLPQQLAHRPNRAFLDEFNKLLSPSAA